MDLNTLRAQHPDVYQAAVDAGVTIERDRVSAHLTMGAAAGTLETAITAVKEGTGMTSAISAEYMAAAMNRRDQEHRQDDDDDVGAAASGAAASEAGAIEADEVVALVERRLGVAGEV